MELDYRKCSKEDIENALKSLSEKAIEDVEIANIFPCFFENEFNMEMDSIESSMHWEGFMAFNGVEIRVAGDAKAGTAYLERYDD